MSSVSQQLTPKNWVKGEVAEALRQLLQETAGVTVTVLDARTSASEWERCRSPEDARPRLVRDGDTLLAFLYKRRVGRVAHALRVTSAAGVSHNDAEFCRCLVHTFDEDVESSHGDGSWEILSASRVARAMASFSSTPLAYGWIRLVEDSMSLTYEGKPFRYTAVFLHSVDQLADLPGSPFVKLAQPLDVEDALLREKWTRAALGSKALALVVASVRKKGKQVVGFLNYAALPTDGEQVRYAPHESLLPLQALLGEQDMAIMASSQGDVFVLLGSGIVFQKSQGNWCYLNYERFNVTLSNALSSDSVELVNHERFTCCVVQMALDLSFERQGALIVVPDCEEDLHVLVPDTADPSRPNRTLRESLVGLKVLDGTARHLIGGAAAIDGAMILSKQGNVLDVACMVPRPSPEKLLAVVGTEVGRTFEGARSMAAWNASIFGTCIKISQDGPITVYRHGRPLLHVGVQV